MFVGLQFLLPAGAQVPGFLVPGFSLFVDCLVVCWVPVFFSAGAARVGVFLVFPPACEGG